MPPAPEQPDEKKTFFSSGSNFFRYQVTKRGSMLIDRSGRLGKPIVGVRNSDGHELYSYYAKESGPCAVCGKMGKYLIEEADHTGLSESTAHVCRDHLPKGLRQREGD